VQEGEVYDEDLAEEMAIGEKGAHDEEYQARKKGVENISSGVEDEGGLFQTEQVDEGDQFMAVKPWLGAVKPPSNYRFNKGDDDAPDATLQLQYVHGYRCHDCRNNISYCAEGTNI